MPPRAPVQQRSAAAPQQQQQPSGKRAALARQAELALWEAEPDLDALRGRLCAALETFRAGGADHRVWMECAFGTLATLF